MWFTIFCMLFGASLVPWYFVIKGTGLLNSIWALVIPSAVPVYNVILLMNFFRNQPKRGMSRSSFFRTIVGSPNN